MGLDVMYARLSRPACGSASDVTRCCRRRHDDCLRLDNWQFRFRVHRDFYP